MSLSLRLLTHAVSVSLVALVAAGTPVCTGQESLIPETPEDADVTPLTQCLMDCTALTFGRKVELGDHRNVRITDSTEDGHRTPREYCWPVDLKCNVGERLEQALVVVPVDAAGLSHQHLEVNSTGPSAATLSAHRGAATLADDCGILYEVTPFYQTTTTSTTSTTISATATPESSGTGLLFCVRVVRQALTGGGLLKCPPLLVTFWQRSADQPKRERGG